MFPISKGHLLPPWQSPRDMRQVSLIPLRSSGLVEVLWQRQVISTLTHSKFSKSTPCNPGCCLGTCFRAPPLRSKPRSLWNRCCAKSCTAEMSCLPKVTASTLTRVHLRVQGHNPRVQGALLCTFHCVIIYDNQS